MTKDLVHQPRGGELGPRLHLGFERAAQAVISAKRSPHTKAAYRRALAKWLAFCDEEGVNPAMPTLEDVTEWRDALEARYANESSRLHIAAMSSVYKTLHRGKAVPGNLFHPAMLAWPPANTLGATRAVTDEVANKMIVAAATPPATRNPAAATVNVRSGARDVAILRLLYDTGLRRSSVAAIQRETYDPETGIVRAVVKGEKDVELELPASANEAVQRWLEVAPPSPHLFPGRAGKHINVASINKLVKHYAEKVGAKGVHPHSFRAAYVTAAYDAGLPEHEIQHAVHHADPKTTRRYDRGARGKKVAKAVESFRKNPKEK